MPATRYAVEAVARSIKAERNNGRYTMRTVKVFKKDLLTTVINNREKHIEQHKEAINDYRAAAIKIAKDNAKLARSEDLDKLKQWQQLPRAPRSYAKEYNRAIRMLEMSVESEIDLEQDVFNQIVLDEWVWKQDFETSNAVYKSYVQ